MDQLLFIAIPAIVVGIIYGITSLKPSTAKALGGFVLVAMVVSSLFDGISAFLGWISSALR